MQKAFMGPVRGGRRKQRDAASKKSRWEQGCIWAAKMCMIAVRGLTQTLTELASHLS